MNFIIFLLPLIIWCLCDLYIAPPLGNWIRRNSAVRAHDTAFGYAEVLIGIGLGVLFGLTFGPVYVIAFGFKPWPWIASFAIIAISHIIGS